MRKILQTIVVEGRHDTENLKKYFDCCTIETGGTSLPETVLNEIREAQKRTGVIVFTDPDAPGNMIRHAVNQAVPGCQNAFVDKKDARTEKKVGVEHADGAVLAEALDHLVTYSDQDAGDLTMADLVDLGLSGGPGAQKKRELLGRKLHIGFGSAKTMLKRLNHLGITYEEIRKEMNDE